MNPNTPAPSIGFVGLGNMGAPMCRRLLGAGRHAAIFAYAQEPGVIGRLERTQQLFGRILPEHEAAERERVRSDALID